MRKKSVLKLATVVAMACLTVCTVRTVHANSVVRFTPVGEVKEVRQVVARFATPMVALGDPRLPTPFTITCAQGRGRWTDTSTWVYDLTSALKSGQSCRFVLRDNLKALSGDALTGTREFAFNTGGPVISASLPEEGESIDAKQVFLLSVDSAVVPATVAQNAYCVADGLPEQIPLEVASLDAETVKRLVKEFPRLKRFGAAPDTKSDTLKIGYEHGLLALRCARTLPSQKAVEIVWGAGIQTVSGLTTREPQRLAFSTRPDFTAEYSCTRVNANARCVPVTPIELTFTSPVSRKVAETIKLTSPQGSAIKPTFDDKSDPVQNLRFLGPLREKATGTAAYRLELPANFTDDSGRPLANASLFPLAIETDEDPPLIKVPGRFGILELNAQPMLPVTVRNVEATLTYRQLQPKEVLDANDGRAANYARAARDAPKGKTAAKKETPARVLRVDQEAAMLRWFNRLQHREYDDGQPGERSVFAGEPSSRDTKDLSLPRNSGDKTFEVIGVPFTAPGFYVVEFASPRLGAALHGEAKPYHVATSVLVTNLAVHFKHGRDNALAWVTTLDGGKPVADAAVTVRDCKGEKLASGQTDASGRLLITKAIPKPSYNDCDQSSPALFVSASKGGDTSFTLTSWSEGIRPWNFNLPARWEGESDLRAHSILDRSLLRAGETVSMRHVVREAVAKGFAFPKTLPTQVQMTHIGSETRYRQPLTWQGSSALSQFAIPKDAKQGSYEIVLMGNGWNQNSGRFRVEQFRVPLLKASLSPVKQVEVQPKRVQFDAQINYLAGGGASNLPIKVRWRTEPHEFSPGDYSDFRFGGEKIEEGVKSEIGRRDDGHEAPESEEENSNTASTSRVNSRALSLDAQGAARIDIDAPTGLTAPRLLEVEMEYSDPNGQILTARSSLPLATSGINLGIKTDGWSTSKERLSVRTVVLDLAGKPMAGRKVSLEAFQVSTYSVRRRMVGGFYSYEQSRETKRLGSFCSATTNAQGLAFCEGKPPATGEIILRAQSADDAGNAALATETVMVADRDAWWAQADHDRIDLVPDKKRYEPGETAKVQVRMPFREATALVSVEREGVVQSFVQALTAASPVVEVPIAGDFAPNAYVSVLVVRGRVEPQAPSTWQRFTRWLQGLAYKVGLTKEAPAVELDLKPTALTDLAKPAYKLGMIPLTVGWKTHALQVKVTPERERYGVREIANAKVSVKDGEGKPVQGDFAFAAVDEGLLALMPNRSWNVLEAMMQTRSLAVETSTAQGQVIGKRHFGKKTAAPGGGGGRGNSRELFETLLSWQGRVVLDAQGEATVQVPLNDSLSAFRFTAVAESGSQQFGTGSATVRTSQALMLFSGLPPLTREGDRYRAEVTVKNGAERPLKAQVSLTGQGLGETTLSPQSVDLQAGEAKALFWDVTTPIGIDQMRWQISATEQGGNAKDELKFTQAVTEAVPVRVLQASFSQIDAAATVPVELPKDAIAGRGGVRGVLRASLSAEALTPLRDYMRTYPYSCLEQRSSRAVALRDVAQWQSMTNSLPTYLDREGLARYWPSDTLPGDDTLTAYVLSIAHEAQWALPEAPRVAMLSGLAGFVEGRVQRSSALATADLTLRKLAAIEALSRYQAAKPQHLQSFSLEPNLWPSSAVIDWLNILRRMPDIPRRAERLAEARSILRSRMSFQGSVLQFSNEERDRLSWLMVSPETNAIKATLALFDDASFKEDLPKLVRGLLGRQTRGHWRTTVGNAWGVLAFEKFGERYETTPVSGITELALGGTRVGQDWSKVPPARDASSRVSKPDGAMQTVNNFADASLNLPWPSRSDASGPAELKVQHQGSGKPWLMLQSRAAVPLQAPVSAGYQLQKTLTPVEQKTKGQWSRGDVVKVELTIDAQADMTWVVVDDPIPAGSTLLGTGLGGESQFALASTRSAFDWNAPWPAFQERTFAAFRSYYRFVPRGKFKVEYTLKLGQPGVYALPPTHVEAMYAPEVFADFPNANIDVKP